MDGSTPLVSEENVTGALRGPILSRDQVFEQMIREGRTALEHYLARFRAAHAAVPAIERNPEFCATHARTAHRLYDAQVAIQNALDEYPEPPKSGEA